MLTSPPQLYRQLFRLVAMLVAVFALSDRAVTAADVAGRGCLLLQDSPSAAQVTRAEQRFKLALTKRDSAYAGLLEEYLACQNWLEPGNEVLAPPHPLERYLRESAVSENEWQTTRTRLLANISFAEFWNNSLYKLSRKATAFAVASEKLERSFHAREKLRHPARYQRGADEVPPGMVMIPGGKYLFPASQGYLVGHHDFQEQRSVKLRSYYLDKREVSNADYARFLLAQPPALREEHLPANWTWGDGGAPLIPDGEAGFPVAEITWTSAASYAEWSGKRLPTENEWQAAAAGFSNRRYPMGNRFDASKTNTQSLGAGTPRQVGGFPEDSTPHGVMCLTGNLREWTADIYQEPAFGKVKAVKSADSTALAVVKGGSFRDRPDKCQSKFRWLFPATGVRLNFIGFRCALDVK
ncbi:MAG: hypothetical protein COB96_06565 [Planctomycetota bacterium]|nr:MAG: hypothetical protein COB96_06565 [Planctomycetota bacterium]